MFPKRFIGNLRRVPAYEPPTGTIATSKSVAWRHVFAAVTLVKHAEGYKLFGFGAFAEHLKRALLAFDRDKYEPLFSDERFLNRAKTFYQEAMAKAFVYSCLVDAMETRSKSAFIADDTRLCESAGCDMIVFNDRRIVALTIATFGAKGSRVSPIRQNQAGVPLARVMFQYDGSETFLVNGLPLPTAKAINRLLGMLYGDLQIASAARFNYRDNSFSGDVASA